MKLNRLNEPLIEGGKNLTSGKLLRSAIIKVIEGQGRESCNPLLPFRIGNGPFPDLSGELDGNNTRRVRNDRPSKCAE